MNVKSIFLTILILISSSILLFAQEFGFLIEITEQQKKKSETNVIYYGMKGDKVVMQPLDDDQEMRIIFNKADHSMIFISDNADSKMAMKMKMPKQEDVEYDFEDYEVDVEGIPNFTKTDKTDKIENYLCHQFLASDDNGKLELWLTKDLPVSFYQLFDFYGMNANPGKQQNESSTNFLPAEFRKYGFPMKVISTNDEGEITTMLFKSISETVDGKKFDTSGYQIQDMSSFQLNYESK